MRSRYVAYLLGRADYIADTTHPDGPQFRADRTRWLAEITSFCKATTFAGLQVQAAGEDGKVGMDGKDAFVQFRATLTRDGRDMSFSERSLFRRHDGRWKYLGPSKT